NIHQVLTPWRCPADIAPFGLGRARTTTVTRSRQGWETEPDSRPLRVWQRAITAILADALRARMSEGRKSLTYSESGVDIDVGNRIVDRIRPFAHATRRSGAGAELGGFGGLFDLKAAGFADPILVAASDGVGTKLKIAIESGLYDTIGIDLVAMCVNDIVVQGAEPLFFLDYFASSKLDEEIVPAVVRGIAEGCAQSGCALIGGETAEMPGLYAAGDFDIAGFA